MKKMLEHVEYKTCRQTKRYMSGLLSCAELLFPLESCSLRKLRMPIEGNALFVVRTSDVMRWIKIVLRLFDTVLSRPLRRARKSVCVTQISFDTAENVLYEV